MEIEELMGLLGRRVSWTITTQDKRYAGKEIKRTYTGGIVAVDPGTFGWDTRWVSDRERHYFACSAPKDRAHFCHETAVVVRIDLANGWARWEGYTLEQFRCMTLHPHLHTFRELTLPEKAERRRHEKIDHDQTTLDWSTGKPKRLFSKEES